MQDIVQFPRSWAIFGPWKQLPEKNVQVYSGKGGAAQLPLPEYNRFFFAVYWIIEIRSDQPNGWIEKICVWSVKTAFHKLQERTEYLRSQLSTPLLKILLASFRAVQYGIGSFPFTCCAVQVNKWPAQLEPYCKSIMRCVKIPLCASVESKAAHTPLLFFLSAS